jgi:uncharacterized membrane protein YhhN
MKSEYVKYLFIIISILEILSNFDFLKGINLITKPLLMPALALFFYYETKNSESNRPKNRVYWALLFAWLGDVFLMFTGRNPIFFMIGLGSFLVMQILYVVIFKPFTLQNLKSKIGIALAILITGLVLLIYLWPNLGGLTVPVVLYFVAILAMVLSALSYWSRNSKAEIIFWGALLFMISDSFIAINKFHGPLPFSGFLVMTTYILAQWLIISGLSRRWV